jgi:hypothetical protein
MARTPSAASKTSIYRIKLAPNDPLTQAAKADYLERDEFTTKEVQLGTRPALLIYGQIPNESPDWLDHVQTLTSYRPACQNDTSASSFLYA